MNSYLTGRTSYFSGIKSSPCINSGHKLLPYQIQFKSVHPFFRNKHPNLQAFTFIILAGYDVEYIVLNIFVMQFIYKNVRPRQKTSVYRNLCFLPTIVKYLLTQTYNYIDLCYYKIYGYKSLYNIGMYVGMLVSMTYVAKVVL